MIEATCWATFIVSYSRAGMPWPPAVAKWLQRGGELSYSLYLTHLIAITLLLHYVGPLTAGSGNLLLFPVNGALALALTWAVSSLTFQAMEQPFLSMRRRYVGINEGRGLGTASWVWLRVGHSMTRRGRRQTPGYGSPVVRQASAGSVVAAPGAWRPAIAASRFVMQAACTPGRDGRLPAGQQPTHMPQRTRVLPGHGRILCVPYNVASANSRSRPCP